MDRANQDLMEALEFSRRRVAKLEANAVQGNRAEELEAQLERCREELHRTEKDLENYRDMRKLEVEAYQEMLGQQQNHDDTKENLNEAFQKVWCQWYTFWKGPWR